MTEVWHVRDFGREQSPEEDLSTTSEVCQVLPPTPDEVQRDLRITAENEVEFVAAVADPVDTESGGSGEEVTGRLMLETYPPEDFEPASTDDTSVRPMQSSMTAEEIEKPFTSDSATVVSSIESPAEDDPAALPTEDDKIDIRPGGDRTPEVIESPPPGIKDNGLSPASYADTQEIQEEPQYLCDQDEEITPGQIVEEGTSLDPRYETTSEQGESPAGTSQEFEDDMFFDELPIEPKQTAEEVERALEALPEAEQRIFKEFESLVKDLDFNEIAQPHIDPQTEQPRNIGNAEEFGLIPLVTDFRTPDDWVMSRIEAPSDVEITYQEEGKDALPFLDASQAIGLTYRGRLIAVGAAGIDTGTDELAIVQLQDVSGMHKPAKPDLSPDGQEAANHEAELAEYRAATKAYFSTGLHNGFDWRRTLAKGWEEIGKARCKRNTYPI